MISPELKTKIRRLYYAEHWKIGTIAAELGVHADTVQRAIESNRFAPRARPVRATLLDPYKDFIAKTLERYPRIRATRLHQMLQKRGYTGSANTLRRYVRTVRPARRREAYLRLETLPGEQGQVDWGHFGTLEVGAAQRTLSCFVLVLSHSRAMYARFFLDQTLESFLRGHVEAFEALGGVPRALLYDNLKSAVLERDGDLIRFHPQLLELAGHYHFAPRPCAPYRGNEKGKVERTIQYLRHSFFYARTFRSLDDLNRQLHAWIQDVAHARPAPGNPARQPVADVLDQERPRLLPLPEHPFPTDVVRSVRSGKTPYVRFDKNDYSIPHSLVGQPLTLVASETRVRILDATQSLVADHARSYDRAQHIEDPEHIAALARDKRHAATHAGRHRILQMCPHAEPFFAELCQRNQPLAPQTARLGRLLDVHGAQVLDAALAQALERGAVSAASVAHILDQARRRQGQPPPLPATLPDDPRVRSLRVTPHALAPYDNLAAIAPEEPDDQSC
jgi:transposase